MAGPEKKPNYNSLAAFRDVMLIGKGQFSTVYRAKCILDHTPVALKKIQVGQTSSPPLRIASAEWRAVMTRVGCVLLQIFQMADAKARQDCMNEIDLLKVCYSTDSRLE